MDIGARLDLPGHVVLRLGDRQRHGCGFGLRREAAVLGGRDGGSEFRLVSGDALCRHAFALAAATVSPSAATATPPPPALGLAAGFAGCFRAARTVGGLTPFLGVSRFAIAGLRRELRLVLRRKCPAVTASPFSNS